MGDDNFCLLVLALTL